MADGFDGLIRWQERVEEALAVLRGLAEKLDGAYTRLSSLGKAVAELERARWVSWPMEPCPVKGCGGVNGHGGVHQDVRGKWLRGPDEGPGWQCLCGWGNPAYRAWCANCYGENPELRPKGKRRWVMHVSPDRPAFRCLTWEQQGKCPMAAAPGLEHVWVVEE